MGKRGFTLIELLAVIIIIGIISAIAIPSIGAVNNTIKKNMLAKKIEIIESAGELLGEDIKGSIIYSEMKYNNYPCKKFLISELVPNYLDKDNDNECLNNLSTSTLGCIEDPSDNSKFLDKLNIIIYYKNKRIYAKVDTENNLNCS